MYRKKRIGPKMEPCGTPQKRLAKEVIFYAVRERLLFL